MTEEELQEIEARAQAATEGPWSATLLNDYADQTTIEGARFVNGNEMPNPEDEPERFTREQTQIHADATFIAHARADVPRLVAEVRRLNALCERLERAVVRMGKER